MGVFMNGYKFLFLLVVSAARLSGNVCVEDSERCFHITTEPGEEEVVVREPESWFHHAHPYAVSEINNDPTPELDYESTWPSQREDYSDSFFN